MPSLVEAQDSRCLSWKEDEELPAAAGNFMAVDHVTPELMLPYCYDPSAGFTLGLDHS